MILRLGIYLGIGAILHLIAVGPYFDWSSAVTWMWLFAWPLPILGYVLLFTAFVVILAIVFSIIEQLLGRV